MRSSSPSPSPSVPPSPSPTACIDTAVLKKIPVVVSPKSAGGVPSDAKIAKAFQKYKGKRVGLLLTFVHGSSIGAGKVAATRINAMLRRKFPAQVTSKTITESYFNETGKQGTVTFVAFLLSADCR